VAWVVGGGVATGIALGAALFFRAASEDRYAALGMVSLSGGRFRVGADDLVASVAGVTLGNEIASASREPFALLPMSVVVGPFSMDRVEVSVRAYARCVAAGACTQAGSAFRCSGGERLASRRDLPITCVSHEQAANFCAWAGKRLPTEVEWEFAARGTAGRRYPWGDSPVDAARLCSRQSEPCAVGSRPAGATPEGIFDLAGNVWEWTSSNHCGRTVRDCGNGFKAVRGGPLTYQHDEQLQAQSAFRHSVPASQRDWDLGFRCAR
jgi:formylglycine-generating enzyme required for sulfatase activity